MPAVDNVIRSMCVGELAVWNAQRVSYDAALAEYEAHNATRISTFLFKIEDGNVSIADKPAFFTREQFAETSNSFIRAANLYKEFLQDVVRTVCPELDILASLFAPNPINITPNGKTTSGAQIQSGIEAVCSTKEA